MTQRTELSECFVCASPMQAVFSATILRKHVVTYYQCGECGLLGPETAYWLEEAYSRTIVDSDTGIVQRNLLAADKLAPLLHFCFDRKLVGIDIGAGYGIFVRRMRDLGFDFYWEDKFCENVFARGFEATSASIGHFDLITALEVLEHVRDPLSFINDVRQRLGAHTLIFTTELYEGPAPPPTHWWYYGFDIGQHISLYTKKTLEVLAKRVGMRFYSFGGVHMFTEQPLRNGWASNFLASRWGRLSLPYISRARPSLTVRDHQHMVKKIWG